MIRCLCAILAGLALALTAPAQAQLRDVLIVERDGAAYLWLAFSAQPAAAALEAGALHVAGVEGETRAIRPAGPAPFSALTLSARADGVRLELHGAAWTDAELREGGVWARLDAAQGHGAHAPLHSSQTPDLVPGAEASADSASPGLTRPDASADAPDPATHGAIPPDDAVPPGGAIPPAPGAERPAAAQAPPGQAARAASVQCAASAQALEDAPWDLDLITAHGQCLAGAGDPGSAREQFERVLAFEPDHARAALGLAQVMEGQGDTDRAAELYEAAARGARTDGEALAAMAAARRLRGGG